MFELHSRRNETADAYMRVYDENNKRITEGIFGHNYKLRIGVNNLDSTLLFFLFIVFYIF